MTKEQAEGKLALLPLLTTVTVGYGEDAGTPLLTFRYTNIPGPGETEVGVDLNPTSGQLENLVDNLPLNAQDKLASLAIMLAPVLPGNE